MSIEHDVCVVVLCVAGAAGRGLNLCCAQKCFLAISAARSTTVNS